MAPDKRPKLKINAIDELQAAFFYNVMMGFYCEMSYKEFLKLSYNEQMWGLSIQLLTDIPNSATFTIDKNNLNGFYF